MKKIIIFMMLVMVSMMSFAQTAKTDTIFMKNASVSIDTVGFQAAYQSTGHSLLMVYITDTSNMYAFFGLFDTEGNVFDNGVIDKTFAYNQAFYSGYINNYKNSERCEVQSGTVHITMNNALTWIQAELNCGNKIFVVDSAK